MSLQLGVLEKLLISPYSEQQSSTMYLIQWYGSSHEMTRQFMITSIDFVRL